MVLAVVVVVVVKLHCYDQVHPAFIGHRQGRPYHPVAFQNTHPHPVLKAPPTPSKTPPLAAWNRPTLYLFMLFETSFTVNPLCLKRHTPIMQQRPALFLSNRSGRYIADHHGIRLPRNNPSLGHTPSKASRTYRRVQVRVQSYFSAAPLGHLD